MRALHIAWEQYEHWTGRGLSGVEMLSAIGHKWDWSFQPHPSYVVDRLIKAHKRLSSVRGAAWA